MSTKKIVGQKYRVIHSPSDCDSKYYKPGDIVTLIFDDGTDRPYFTGNSGDDSRGNKPKGYQSTIHGCYISMIDIKLLSEETPQEKVKWLEQELAAAKAQLLPAWTRLKEGDVVQIQVSVHGNGGDSVWINTTVAQVEPADYRGNLPLAVNIGSEYPIWIGKDDFRLKS